LHYSAQASWVPLKPWAAPAEFAWLTSEEFLAALEPVARGYYERLRTAERTDDVLAFARDGARAHGWEAQEK
jgi:hypothetical protein